MEKNQNLDTKNKISRYEPAPMAKRLFAGIMDAAVFIFVFLAMALWVFTFIANAAFGYNDLNNVGKRYHLATHLYLAQKIDDDGNLVVVPVKDSTGNMNDYSELTLYSSSNENPSFYIERIYYYYHNFKTNVDIELPTNGEYDPINDHFASPEYSQEINGVLPVDLYTNEWFSKEILKVEEADSFFEIASESESYLASIKVKEGSNNSEVITFLKNRAYEATGDMYHSDYFQAIEKQIEKIQYFI